LRRSAATLDMQVILRWLWHLKQATWSLPHKYTHRKATFMIWSIVDRFNAKVKRVALLLRICASTWPTAMAMVPATKRLMGSAFATVVGMVLTAQSKLTSLRIVRSKSTVLYGNTTSSQLEKLHLRYLSHRIPHLMSTLGKVTQSCQTLWTSTLCSSRTHKWF